ncbi:MAG: hypothetical protein MRY32_00095 [Rickettsiales bacterium]|nr:hypothetical protein [Rickettsiales bacterium]
MEPIEYHFSCADGSTHNYKIELDKQHDHTDPNLPDWTALEFNQCEGCEWSETDRCPVAVAMIEPVTLLQKLPSYETLDVTVKTEHRTYSAHTSAQEALSSFFGLIMATSGCPAFWHFKGLAEFHLPFASMEETLFRSMAAHMMYAHFKDETHRTQDVIDEVKQSYENMGKVNKAFIMRVREGVYLETDSSFNALVILDALSSMVTFNLEQEIEELKRLFA